VRVCAHVQIRIHIYIYTYMNTNRLICTYIYPHQQRPRHTATNTHTHAYTYICIHTHRQNKRHHCCGVATMSRRLRSKGLFCKRATCKRLYFAKETYNFQDPTNRSHPIEIVETCVQIKMGRAFLSAGYDSSLLQNIVSFIGLFCIRDLYF